MALGAFISLGIMIIACAVMIVAVYVYRGRIAELKEDLGKAYFYQEKYQRTFTELCEARARIADLENEKNVGKWLPYYNELNERIDALKRVVMAQESVIKAIQQAYHELEGRKKR